MAVWRYVGYAAQCVIALTCVIGFDSAAPVPIYLFIYIIYIYIYKAFHVLRSERLSPYLSVGQ